MIQLKNRLNYRAVDMYWMGVHTGRKQQHKIDTMVMAGVAILALCVGVFIGRGMS